jgi:hypothetical protein
LDFHPHSSQISRRRFSMESVPPVRANAPARSLSRGTGPAPVTRGNGYVGRELCRQLYGQHEISVVDTLRYGTNRFSEGDLSRIRMVQTDVTDAAALARTIGEFGPDAVIHLAAIHDIPGCETDPALAVRTDVAGTVNALMACRRRAPPPESTPGPARLLRTAPFCPCPGSGARLPSRERPGLASSAR